MTSSSIHGQFLWHELETADPDAAAAFYRQVLGWRSEAWREDSSYTVWLSSRGPAGGMMRMPAEGRAHDGTSRWLSYVAVADLDATLSTVERLAGRIVTPATPLPDGGRYAVIADPQSALLGILAPPERWSGEQPMAEAFVWHELASSDHAAAFRFYRELFGWEQLGVHDMGGMGPYLIFGRNGRRLGGMFDRPASMAASRLGWLPYVRVSSARDVAKSADAAGGRVISGPHQVPGGSWVVQLADPAGAALAANQDEPRAAEAETATATREERAGGKPDPALVARSKPAASAAARRSSARKPASRGTRRKASPRKPAARKSAARQAAGGKSGSAASKTRRKKSGARAAASRKSKRSAPPRPRNASSRPGRKRSSSSPIPKGQRTRRAKTASGRGARRRR